MSNIVTQTPVKHPGIWRGEELFQRHDWEIELTQDDLGELDSALKSTSHLRLNEIDRDNFQIPKLGSKLLKIQDSLENGSGCTRILGFPVEDYDETQARRVFWGISRHIGSPVSQSAEGERIFSVRDAGYQQGDPRLRGPNSSNRLSFHSDRCDVIGFLCWRQARSGGENEVVNSIALYNEILLQRPDLMAELVQPYYYKRHTVDLGNQRPWCRQPIFSIHEGHFACNILRVLIDRAYALPELPDLRPVQLEALNFVETTAARKDLNVRFRLNRGDLLFCNNFTTLHRRTAYEDYEDEELRRHLFRIWLSVPNSRPLHPHFKDNYGAIGSGEIRGGIHPPST